MSSHKFRAVPIFFSVGVMAALVAFIAYADMFRSHVVNATHAAFPVVAPVVLILFLVGASVAAFAISGSPSRRSGYDDGYYGRNYNRAPKSDEAVASEAKAARNRKVLRYVGGFLAVATVVAVGFIIKYWVTLSYGIDRQYVSAVKVVNAPAPTFAQRPAYDVAVASAKTNLGDVTGDLGAVRFVGKGSTDSWNALVERRATLGGYAAVQEQHIGLTGSSQDPTICKFDSAKADRKLGGMFTHSLDRAIYARKSGVKIEHGDAYGVCLNGHATVVVPLLKVKGWLYPHEVPAGVAVYDGVTGQTRVLNTVKPGELPGPVYSITLAARTRQAAAALGSFSDYWHNRAGFEDTNSDSNDPNGDNRAEFSMRTVDGGSAYVTPLTPRGTSVNIVGEGTMNNNSVTSGVLNTLTVHKLPTPRLANSAFATHVRADYGDLPEWATGHMSVYEVTPITTTEWVASIGMNQDILYRVRMDAKGQSCLERADGTKLRCGKVTGLGGFGAGVALQNGTTTTGEAGPVPSSDAALGKLTDAQLLALQERVVREVAARLNGHATATPSASPSTTSK